MALKKRKMHKFNELYSSISGSLAFDITDGSNTQTVSNTQTITFASTANQITATVSATDTVTFSLPSDVTITGNFTASGTGTHSLGTIQVSGNTITSSDASTITINETVSAVGYNTTGGLFVADETAGYPRIRSLRGDDLLIFDAIPVTPLTILLLILPRPPAKRRGANSVPMTAPPNPPPPPAGCTGDSATPC